MKNALIVDDIEDYIFSIETYLEDNFSVYKSTSLDEAKKIVGTIPLDLAVVDIRLNESDEKNREGLELLKYLKNQSEEIKIIVMSAYKDFGSAVEALNLGADYYLQKPLSPKELNSTLARLFNKTNDGSI